MSLLFNSDLAEWDTSRVTDTSWMFRKSTTDSGDSNDCILVGVNGEQMADLKCANTEYDPSFNGDVSKWQTGRVTDMSSMFFGCEIFDTDVSKWDTESVNDMSYMFM